MKTDFSSNNIQLVPHTITGFRSWAPHATLVYGRTPKVGWNKARWGEYSRLYPLSVFSGSHWHVNQENALCVMRQGHVAPCLDCSCGLYAHYLFRSDLQRSIRRATISGVISASGIIVLGTTGFRAQKAKIIALLKEKSYSKSLFFFGGNVENYNSYVEHVASYYRVPALFEEELIRQFPPTNLSNLIGSS